MSDPVSTPASLPLRPAAPTRRRLLQGGATLGAALVAGAGLPRAGRAQPAPDDPSKVPGGPLRPYGARSRFEESVRESAARRSGHVRRELLAPRRHARDHHAVGAALRGAARRHARHRPPQAPAPHPRDGRASGDADHGGDPALALHLAHPLPRVPGQLDGWSGARPPRVPTSRGGGRASRGPTA